MVERLFCIGNFCFRLVCPIEMTIPEHFLLFEVNDGIPEYTYSFHFVSSFPPIKGRIIAQRRDLIVFETDGGEGRFLGIKGQESFYACYREVSLQQAEVLLNENMRDLHIDPIFTSLFALERQMIKHASFILHCAYIEYHGKAILFSAPSETGKTTQAGLWEQYKGTQTINGDRGLLVKEKDEWMVYGWPVCGTSQVCHNKKMPILAIVMLKQAPYNQVKQLKPSEAFINLYSQITINGWNPHTRMKSIEYIENLIKDIPILQLECTISKEAVECLEQALKNKNNHF